jgi:hypothetical protein
MRKYLLTLGLLIFLFTACTENRNELDLKTNKVEISMCSICGWCAGGDSLLVTQEKTYFESNTECGKITKNREIETPENDWDELLKLLDKEEFQKIEINTCNVCVDGCDTWITLNDGGKSHTIRFGFNDSLAIAEIQPFVDKLKEIRAKIDTP